MDTYYSYLSQNIHPPKTAFRRFKKECFQLTNLTCQDSHTQLDLIWVLLWLEFMYLFLKIQYHVYFFEKKKLLRPCFFFSHTSVRIRSCPFSHTSVRILPFFAHQCTNSLSTSKSLRIFVLLHKNWPINKKSVRRVKKVFTLNWRYLQITVSNTVNN